MLIINPTNGGITIKVLALATNHPDTIHPSWGLYNKWSIESLIDQGIEVQTIIPRPHSLPFSRYREIPIFEKNCYMKHYPRYWYLVPKRFFYGFNGDSYKKKIQDYIKSNKLPADIIHSFHIYPDGYGIFEYAHKKNIPLVVSSHGTIVRDIIKWKLVREKIIGALENADAVLCVSGDLKNRIETLGIEPEKVHLVPLGVNLQRFKPEKKEQLKKEHGFSNKIVVTFIGQLSNNKGIDIVLKSSTEIEKIYGRKVHFLLIGEGKIKNDVLFKKNISILGFQEPYKVAKYLTLSDIFILPSRKEGRPTVIYEAMAAQLPVIASPVGGIPEQIDHGNNGFLLKDIDQKNLTDYLQILIDDQNLCKKMGLNSRKRLIKMNWTHEAYAKKTKKIYEKIL